MLLFQQAADQGSQLFGGVIAECCASLWLLVCPIPPVKNATSEVPLVSSTWGAGIAVMIPQKIGWFVWVILVVFFVSFVYSFYQKD